ncbi:MAG: hypothetical protein ACREV8_04290, partial [Gammaproteobacteria bacterium]
MGDLLVAALAGTPGDVRRDLPGVQLTTFDAGQEASAQLLTEAHVDRLSVTCITIEIGVVGGLSNRVAQLRRSRHVRDHAGYRKDGRAAPPPTRPRSGGSGTITSGDRHERVDDRCGALGLLGRRG